MSIKLRQVTLIQGLVVDILSPNAPPGRPPEPGEWWYAPHFWTPDKPDAENFVTRGAKRFNEHYWATWADRRPPIFMMLPNGAHFSPDMGSTNGSGWTVNAVIQAGVEPARSASPSIIVEDYHGWLKDGELSDDLEGRQYGEKAPVQ